MSEAEKHEKYKAISQCKSLLSEKEAKLSQIKELELTLKNRDEEIELICTRRKEERQEMKELHMINLDLQEKLAYKSQGAQAEARLAEGIRSKDISSTPVTLGVMNSLLEKFKSNIMSEVFAWEKVVVEDLEHRKSLEVVHESDSISQVNSGTTCLPTDWAKFCKNVTPFNPEVRPALGIEEFLAALKSKLSVRMPPFENAEKIAILKMVIEGSTSLQILNYEAEVMQDFDRVCEKLEKDFGRFSCEEAAIEALRGKEGKQRVNEGPIEFLRRLQRLFSRAFGKNFHGRDDVQLRLAFVDGLLPHIRQQVEALAINDLDSLIAKAEIFHHKKFRPKEIQVYQVQNQDTLELEDSSTKQKEREGKSSPQPKRKKGECWNCGKLGHLARECWAKKPSQAQSSKSQPHPPDFLGYLKKMISQFETASATSMDDSPPEAGVGSS